MYNKKTMTNLKYLAEQTKSSNPEIQVAALRELIAAAQAELVRAELIARANRAVK